MPEKKPEKPKKSNKSTKSVSTGDKEVDALLKRARKMDDWLQGKVSTVCEKSGHSRSEVMEFLEDPGHITKDVLQNADKQAKELEKKIIEIFGEKAKKSVTDKKQVKAKKKRKGKFIGARKKWLQM